MSNTTPAFANESKVRILVDRKGNPHNHAHYGYIRAVNDCKDAPDGFICTEKGFQKEGYAYLVQTSWSSGMLWYSADALKPAKGTNRLNEWKKKINDYHLKYSR